MSAKPTIATSTDTGLLISSNIPEAIPQNQTREFEIHVFNKTDIINTSTICFLHIYKESSNGGHAFTNETNISVNHDYEIIAPAYVHEQKGEYSYKAYCDNGEEVGLFETSYYVTKNGFAPAGDFVTMLIYVMFIIAGLLLMYSLIMNLIKLAMLETTIFDVLLSWGGIILLMFVIYLSENFLLSFFIEDISNTIFYAVTASNGILPLAAFILSFIVKVWTKKKKNVSDYVGRQFK